MTITPEQAHQLAQEATPGPFPAVVVAPADQVRAAREALEEE